MNLKLELNLNIKEKTEVVVGKKIPDFSLEVTEYTHAVRVVPHNTEDLQIDLGGVSVGKVLFLSVDNPLYVKFNDIESSPILVSKFLLIKSEITKLFVTNDSNLDVTLEIIVCE